MIERSIDYLQASLLLSESAVIMKGFKPVPPIRFYKRGYLHPKGFRMYFGNPNSNKASVVGSGEVLGSLRNDGYLDAEILDWFLSRDAEISRLDLAVTEWIEDELFTLEDVEKWAKEDLIESTLLSGGIKKISEVFNGGCEEVQTLYIGSMKKRGKKGIFRAYDKGVELGIGAEMITRIELELKRENADATARRLAESNDIAGNFRSRFNVKSPVFERIMDADAVPVVRGKNKAKTPENEALDKRWEWLLSQVAPALSEAIKDDRKAGLGDARLISFMSKAGLIGDARQIASHLADVKFRDMLQKGELVPQSRGKKADEL
jgi:DNA relaxase NicK